MIVEKLTLSKNRPVLDQIIEAQNITYTDFANQMGIKYRALLRYRKGEIEFRLNTAQIKQLIAILGNVGLKVEDLPDDWILESSDLASRIAG